MSGVSSILGKKMFQTNLQECVGICARRPFVGPQGINTFGVASSF